MKKIKFIFLNALIIVFISAIFVFAAEVKNPSTAPAPAKVAAVETKAPAQAQANPAPAAQAQPITEAVNYSYNPSGKPDPFFPFIEVEAVKKKKAEKKGALSIFPLQRAEADQYTVVGIVGSEDHRVAIAEDSAKKFYPLLIGTRIGLHNGKVVEITDDRVIVEEDNENSTEKKVILKLHKN